MVKLPPSAACPPSRNGITWRVMFGSSVSSSRRCSCARITLRPPVGRRSAASSTTAHSVGGCGRLVRICCLVMRSLTRRSTSSPLAFGPPRDGHRAGVVLGLQQPGHELDLVGAHQAGGLLQTDVGLEPGGQDVVVGVPPSLAVGLTGQGEQRVPLGLVSEPVEREEVRDVPFLEADPARARGG